MSAPTGGSRRYRIEHRTVYSYDDEVSASYGRGYLRPRDLPWQRCLEHRVVTRPAAADSGVGLDVYGNTDLYFHVTRGHRELQVESTSVVEIDEHRLDAEVVGVPWESARPDASADAEAIEFVLPSPRVDLSDAVARFAAPSFPAERPIASAVLDLGARIHREFEYRAGSTTVTTRVDDVLTARSGVCQDFAHLAVACLRSLGLAARYVSGYLATDPPEGGERVVGVDASHAWPAVWLPGHHWFAFDPTNDQAVDERYTTVAWGRDYGDVPPLRGVIFTDATASQLQVSVDVTPLNR